MCANIHTCEEVEEEEEEERRAYTWLRTSFGFVSLGLHNCSGLLATSRALRNVRNLSFLQSTLPEGFWDWICTHRSPTFKVLAMGVFAFERAIAGTGTDERRRRNRREKQRKNR
jgi:hypothetical protein